MGSTRREKIWNESYKDAGGKPVILVALINSACQYLAMELEGLI